VAELVGKS